VVSGAGLGYVAEHYGWDWAYITMITMALIGMFIFSLMWRAKMDGYDRLNAQ
jgi:sugar phosphate permease